MKGLSILLDPVRKAMGISALYLLGLSLAPATTSAQAPPPGGGGGSGPTITWTYSGSYGASPGPNLPITSAQNLSFQSSSIGPKTVWVDATITATITWPEGVSVPQEQWFKLYLKSSADIVNYEGGTVLADNGWTDTATGQAGRSALSEGRHLIKRRVIGRQVVLEYHLTASVSGTSYAMGKGVADVMMAVELTDRKAELFREDNGHKVVSEDGTAYTARTLPTGAMFGPTANVQNLKLLLSGSWNHLPYGTASLNSPTSWMEQVFYFLALTSPPPYSQVFTTMVKGYCADDTQTFNVSDPDGYSTSLSWTWKPTYEIQDYVDDPSYPQTYFKPIALVGYGAHSTGPTDQVTLSGTVAWGGTISASSGYTMGIQVTVKFPAIPGTFLEPSIAGQYQRSWTQTVAINSQVGAGVSYVRAGEATPGGTTWKLAIGVFYTKRKGRALVTNVLGEQQEDPAFELLFPKDESYGFYPIHENLWSELNIAKPVDYWWGPLAP